ncbi:hypothetical protein A1O3_02432 [Capronia epimyces CBS 606.96]|uniref:Acyl-CoA dehydrogenase/oxidase C-terminal domain-containing protein n=1 Tax=Capronia epimyces CBS 606.96 TaxID=1182542 RepID=W9YI99_9EURO|nr:uncharacterized protein A1O3_02432 [Capronia epimyces CBS 606.96]EXJ89365.1 hypothetical protein A1O3_02432 [Capronia epimyces CBS 606.96]
MELRKPSSSTTGFFQALPIVPPQYSRPASNTASASRHDTSDDTVLPRILSLYLPDPIPAEISEPLHDFSRLVLHPSTLEYTVDCDTDQPTLHPLTTFGEVNKRDPLRTSEGWRALKQIQTRAGVVGYGYPHLNIHQNFNRRVHQFATLHLWSGTCAVATCPMAMTDGAAVLLRRHLDDPDADQPGRGAVFLESYKRLVSLDPAYAWTSGQWMTERTGGSDVRGTETVARRMTAQEIQSDVADGRDQDAHGLPLGPWLIDGFKWFSSATDADMAVLLAQTSKGLSAFYAPLRRRVGRSSRTAGASAALTTETSSSESSHPQPSEMNGVRLQRLKSKLGTKGLPTAELELKGMRAFLIGSEGQGVKEISAVLNITRLYTASAGAGYLARGLAVSRAYTQVRRVRGGQLLRDNAQHLAWMAGESVKYRANTHLVFLGAALLGASEQGHDAATTGTRAAALIPRDKAAVDTLLRILTPVMKAQVTLNSVSGLRACMESLGGVGYCENNDDGGVLNIARLFRDSVVGTIWEGTTSVMAEDLLRVIKNPKTKTDVLDRVFGAWSRHVLAAVNPSFASETDIVRNRYHALRHLVRRLSADQLQRRGREVLEHIEAIACACLLMFDASVDQDAVATAIARRWVRSIALPSDSVQEDSVIDPDWAGEVDLDRRIYLGPNAGALASAQPKL